MLAVGVGVSPVLMWPANEPEPAPTADSTVITADSTTRTADETE